MYKKIITTLTLTFVSSLALAGADFSSIDDTEALIQAPDSKFYLETTKDTKLSVFHKDAFGNNSMSQQITAPEGTIISLNLTSFATRTNENWICGIRVVDIMDDDIREAISEEENFCVRTTDTKELTLLDSSNGKNKEAFLNFQKSGQLFDLVNLAYVAAQQIVSNENIAFFNATATPKKIISPLKNCNEGCLQATSEYGMRMHPVLKTRRLHKGIDLQAASGSSVVSVYDGRVLATRTERHPKTKKIKGYGHYVIIIHPQKQIETLYAHLSAFKTTQGKPVSQGELIALSGNSGIGTGPHLHFEVHVSRNQGSVAVNPRKFIGRLLNVAL